MDPLNLVFDDADHEKELLLLQPTADWVKVGGVNTIGYGDYVEWASHAAYGAEDAGDDNVWDRRPSLAWRHLSADSRGKRLKSLLGNRFGGQRGYSPRTSKVRLTSY